MSGTLIDGKALAEKVRAQVAEEVTAFGEPVCLATMLVGDDPASHVYVGSKHEASHEAGNRLARPSLPSRRRPKARCSS